MKGKLVDIKQLNAAKELLYKAATHAGIKFDPEELASCNWLSDKILAEIGVTSAGQRIREFYKIDPMRYTSNSFRLNKVKEVLAAFVMLKESRIKKSDIQCIDNSKPDKEKSIKTIYFLLYYSKVAPNISSDNGKQSSEALSNESIYDLILIQNEIPSYLIGSTWRFYNFDEEGTIYGDIFTITEQKLGHLYKCKLYNSVKEYQDYEGWAGMDGTLSHLIINLINTDTRQKYAHMMCKISLGTNPNLFLGIVTYIASLKGNLAATIIAFEKLETEIDQKSIVYSDENPAPNEIQRLFKSKNLRLRLPPDRNIINFERLNKWLDDQNDETSNSIDL